MLHAGVFFQQGLDALAQHAAALAVNDSKIVDIGFETGVDIIVQKGIEFARSEGVQIEDAVNGDDYRFHSGCVPFR